MDDSPRRSFFESFTQLVVPVVATVATVLFQQQRMIAFGLITVAVLSLLISGAPRVTRWFRQRTIRRKERIVSAAALEALRGRIHKFEEFVNTRCNDTLYSIIFSKLCQSNQAHYDDLHLAPVNFFGELWEQLRNRVDRAMPSFEALRESVLEFNTLVSNYCRYLACPVYETVPSKLPPEMLKVYQLYRVENDLIQFRERFDRFLGDYMDFLKDLDRKLPSPFNLGYYFERPKPLSVGNGQVQASLSVR